MGVCSEDLSMFESPNIVTRPFRKALKRKPNLENCPSTFVGVPSMCSHALNPKPC